MGQDLKQGLGPVRTRLQASRVVRTMAAGWVVSSVVAIGLGLARWAGWVDVTSVMLWSVVLAGPVIGVVVAMMRRPAVERAATQVDEHFGLKDRVLSAVELQEASGESETRAALRSLQRQDALDHLERVRPAEAARVGFPRLLPVAAVLTAAAIVLSGWPPSTSEAQAEAPEANPEVLAVADEILADIEEMEERAEEEGSEELDEIAQEMREMVEELEAPDMELREALAKISEMQEMLAAKQAEFSQGMVDANLKALGEAMQGAEPLDAVGKSLESGEFGEAAELLNSMAPADGSAPSNATEQRAMQAAAERMQQVATQMHADKLAQMGDSTAAMAKALDAQQMAQAQQAANQLAKMVQRHAQCKNLAKCLGGMCNKLGQCKGGLCAACNGQGKGQGKKNSMAKNQGSKTDKPSLNWGMGTHGGIDGPPTYIDSERDLESITGVLGSGDSEYETLTGPEQKEASRRSFKELHQEYSKMSEAVLESEALPLGHRETIRRYFESIRPTQEELEATEAEESSEER